MQKHPLHKEINWLRNNWKHVEVCNYFPSGYLVITISLNEKGGQGATFTQSQISECINYVKKKNAQLSKQLFFQF